MKAIDVLVITIIALSTNIWPAEDCKPSKWGAGDEIGSANLVTPEQVIMASKLVKEGKTHPLGVVIEAEMPAFPPRYTRLQIVQPGQQFGLDGAEQFGWQSTYNDDVLQMWLGTGPKLDGLGHIGEAGEFYNCNMGKDFSDISGLTKLGIEKVPPMVGRGVLLNMAQFYGVDSMSAGQPISAADIKSAAKLQEIEIREGDVVLFHTGWTDAKLKTEPDLWVSTEPGITNGAAVYLASLNPMAVGADTWAVGAIPPIEGDKVFYDHITLLKENGIYMLETMNTGHLAREGVKEFMFVLGQARLKGASQMIINPVALW